MIMYSMAISTNEIKKATVIAGKWLRDEDSPKSSFQRLTHTCPPENSRSFVTTSPGERMSIARIQVERMKNRHSFELMSGGRRGNTTAPNRSTAMRTKL